MQNNNKQHKETRLLKIKGSCEVILAFIKQFLQLKISKKN